MPCCGAEPAGAPAILTQRAARGESGRLWRRSSRACRRRLMSGKLSLPSGKVFSQQAERRGIALLAALSRRRITGIFSVKLHCEKDRKREKKRARSARRRRAAPPQAADSRCAKLNAIFGSAVLALTSNVGMID